VLTRQPVAVVCLLFGAEERRFGLDDYWPHFNSNSCSDTTRPPPLSSRGLGRFYYYHPLLLLPLNVCKSVGLGWLSWDLNRLVVSLSLVAAARRRTCLLFETEYRI